MAIRENNHTLPKSFASLITLQSWAGFPSAEEKRNIINMHKIGHANIFRVCATFWNNKMGNCILLFFFKFYEAREASSPTFVEIATSIEKRVSNQL